MRRVRVTTVAVAKYLRHIVICGLSGPTVFFAHYLINGTIFGEKKVTEYKKCFDFLYNFSPKYFSF
jgi:hypothetical protein